ncbi:uncharacterized protein TNIN_71731 [Trichonephila inaurata madagascariensis]|uniref:Uncharacterized protein n=1 Tax=Trichonephila inaurata madagascariensis TaxID=2747483 RepID=A0A8X6X657_9ARAC|nr:uncharacterized protein TNIN_71731 [Trichonephila inaurata madagascariensis]
MSSTYRYEFLKGKPVSQLKLNSDRSSKNCIYKETLQAIDKNKPVDIYKIHSGPILNPSIQVTEQHTYLKSITKENKPEKGGLCKYFKSTESEYCCFCLQELFQKQTKLREFETKRKKNIKEVGNVFRLCGKN